VHGLGVAWVEGVAEAAETGIEARGRQGVL
jgi:hypothetical protein